MNNKENINFDNKFIINKTYIEIVTSYKYLGFIIDNKLKFKEQVDNK